MKETSKFKQVSATEGFGERLAQERREKAARDQRDIAQKDVAEAVGSSAPSVSRWEAGVGGPPSDAMVERLAAYFGVTPSWLRYGQEPRRLEVTPRPVRTVPAETIKPHVTTSGRASKGKTK